MLMDLKNQGNSAAMLFTVVGTATPEAKSLFQTVRKLDSETNVSLPYGRNPH